MIRELCFMSDNLNQSAICENDDLLIIPFSGKKKKVKLKRTSYLFTSDQSYQSPWIIHLNPIQKEKIKFELVQVDTVGRNNKNFKRFILKSLNGIPFKLNGNYVFESFIEKNDICELGYHRLEFIKCSRVTEKPQYIYGIDQRMACSDVPILIEGETGVGKSYLAKKIHEMSSKKGSFVHVNLCSFSHSLIESELFGHVKGAFTGAINDKKGALREAEGGTLFLDEIDSLSIEMQTKLLLFLEDFTVRPVGGQVQYKVSTRIICAGGKSLDSLVKDGFMRKDFYFRISSGKKVKLKCLSKNRDKIKEVIYSYCQQHQIYITAQLSNYYSELAWPGNIRQLVGHLEKKRMLSNSSKLNFCSLDDDILKSNSLFEEIENCTELTLKELKSEYALRTFHRLEKNYALAAKKLDISIRTLRRLLAA